LAAERSVWALGVVVVDVDAQGAVELALSDDQQPVQAFGSCGPHEPFGVRVGLRRAKRRLDTSMPSVRKTSSKPAANFARRKGRSAARSGRLGQ
jgi:hypothetical protein